MIRSINCSPCSSINSVDAHKQAGFGLVSMLGSVAIVLLVYQGFSSTLAYYRATPRVNQTASHMEKVSLAAGEYVQDHYADLTASLPLNGATATIPLATLKESGYMSPSLANTNSYGQGYTLRVRYITQGSGANTRNVLEPLVVTEGGHPIDDNVLLRIAGKVNAGGSIRSNSPEMVVGNSGGWEVPLASFGGSPGAGHLAVGMFFSDAGMIADYLYRNSVPGRPEVNRMNADIDMDGNDVDGAGTVETDRIHLTAANGQSMWMQNDSGKLSWIHDDLATELASLDDQGNFKAKSRLTAGEYLELEGTAVEGTACPKDGLVSRSSAGLILSCQSGVWKKQALNDPQVWNYGQGEPFGVSSKRYCPTGTIALASGSFSAPSGRQVCQTSIGYDNVAKAGYSHYGGCGQAITTDTMYYHYWSCMRP